LKVQIEGTEKQGENAGKKKKKEKQEKKERKELIAPS